MTFEPHFLALSDVIEIHDREISISGGLAGIRDLKAIESAIGVPRATFDGEYLNDFFGMAVSYITSIAFNHPFLDGNKRTALASALTFLDMNGYEVTESYEEELADKVLALVKKDISKEDLIQYFRERSHEI